MDFCPNWDEEKCFVRELISLKSVSLKTQNHSLFCNTQLIYQVLSILSTLYYGQHYTYVTLSLLNCSHSQSMLLYNACLPQWNEIPQHDFYSTHQSNTVIKDFSNFGFFSLNIFWNIWCLLLNQRSNCQYPPDHQKNKRFPEKHLFLLYWLRKSLRLCGSQ